MKLRRVVWCGASLCLVWVNACALNPFGEDPSNTGDSSPSRPPSLTEDPDLGGGKPAVPGTATPTTTAPETSMPVVTPGPESSAGPQPMETDMAPQPAVPGSSPPAASAGLPTAGGTPTASPGGSGVPAPAATMAPAASGDPVSGNNGADAGAPLGSDAGTQLTDAAAEDAD
jgi:hypothetical protein